jgi:hypothetical protein
MRRGGWRWIVVLAAVAAAPLRASAETTSTLAIADSWLEERAAPAEWSTEAWPAATIAPDLAGGVEEVGPEWMVDHEISLAQAVEAPPVVIPRSPTRVNTALRRPALRGAALGTLASIPYMIGDTGAGTCLGFRGLLDVGLAHPTLACSRLNVAEANSALPADRVYYSYRHFDNATPIEVYQYEQELDVDRHLLAFEKTYWDGMCSIEMRLPIEYRLTSDFFSIVAPSIGRIDLVDADNERRTELGNVSVIFKSLIVERESLAISGGLGVTLPTAQDVDYKLAVQGIVDFPSEPGLSMATSTTFQSIFANETVYLLPFMAWLYAPSSRWYHQGFLQFEVAANPSRVTSNGLGANLFIQNGVPVGFYDYWTGATPGWPYPEPVRGELFSQTLMRTNLGGGYQLWEGAAPARGDRTGYGRLMALGELHYTTTLEDANLTDVPLNVQASGGTAPLQEIQIGNINNRVDMLNAAVGASLQINLWMLNGGVIVPLRDCPDCGYDIEYNAQVQRLF